jgi:hypothetical protein
MQASNTAGAFDEQKIVCGISCIAFGAGQYEND